MWMAAHPGQRKRGSKMEETYQGQAADVADKSITVTADENGKPFAEDVELDKETKITWELDDSVRDQWDLVAIEWKPSETADYGEFIDWEGSGKNNGKKIKVKDKCSKTADFPYRIWVVASTGVGAPVASEDPTIRNRPPE